MLHFEKSSKMAKNEEKSCPWHLAIPKPVTNFSDFSLLCNSSDPPKKPKKNPIIKFFQNLINKNSPVVSDSNPGKNSSPKTKKKAKKPQKKPAAAGPKIDFGIETTQTLGHFEKPKPPQNRSRPRASKRKTT